MPRDLRARADERVYFVTPEAHRSHRRPDLRVIEERWNDGPREAAGGLAVAEPLVYRLSNDPITEVYLQIIDVASQGRVVTGLEFLSPSNKVPGRGRAQASGAIHHRPQGALNLSQYPPRPRADSAAAQF